MDRPALAWAGQTGAMRTYGQYCPIARAAEVLGERWTPIILRSVLSGADTFTRIAGEAPGIPRTLLTHRLQALQQVGVIEATPKPSGHGSRYHATAAGRELAPVLLAMGGWAERWLELRPEHLDPGMVLDAWCRHDLDRGRLPDRRVVARFDFPDQPHKTDRFWFIFDGERSEVCRTYPGFDEDLIVTTDSRTLIEWHLRRIEWSDALRSERISVSGPRELARALPSWDRRAQAVAIRRGTPPASVGR